MSFSLREPAVPTSLRPGMDIDDFSYDLPEERIAQFPVTPRHAARLLVDRGPGRDPSHRHVADLAELLEPGDLLVVNDTRVIPARLALRRATGAAVEVLLLEERAGRVWEALVRPSRRLRPGEVLRALDRDVDTACAAPLEVQLQTSLGEGRWELAFAGDVAVQTLLDVWGEVPLPPYINEPLADPERYQTIFARRPGSVAAPTAGLHLSPLVLAALGDRGVHLATVELVVGLGTFRPITVSRLEDHVMHQERYAIPAPTIDALSAARAEGRPVVAVGTTVVRTLESWAASGQSAGSTGLFIRRPYRFSVVDRLLTNFHVPRSSLLVMIDALVGPRWRELYQVALSEDYRFLSFGDAMLLDRNNDLR